MRIVAHLSDLHFGTEDVTIADAVRQDVATARPDLVVVSGDLTQRARSTQFRSAAEYLATLPSPQLIIPGNHDIPLYNVWRRFRHPLTRYRKDITSDLNPVYRDAEMLVMGLNTARSATWKNGRISMYQIKLMEEMFRAAGPELFKVVVTHHPFIPPPGDAGTGIALVGRATRALEIIDRGGVDLLLAGHLHTGYTGDVRTYYPGTSRSVIVAQAGTAFSRRLRSSPNAWSLITLHRRHIAIDFRAWDGHKFRSTGVAAFSLTENGWNPEVAAIR
jgi:3',5'-cyclic AMP phosphodiesterase CpdA